MKDPVVFCAKEQFQTQRFLNETLQFGEVQYQMDDWFSLNSGIFTVPTSGKIIFRFFFIIIPKTTLKH